MEDLPLQKIAISGPTLASLFHRISSSHGDSDGLLFGHVAPHITASSLSDDDSPSPLLVATVTSFLSPSSPLSFYDSVGRLHSSSLRRLLSDRRPHLLGWFSARRRTPLRPSMREFSVTRFISAEPDLRFPVEGFGYFSPCVFLLFATPVQDQLIHTHEYRSYQFRTAGISLEPKPIDVVNIGPAFRGHYGAFCPNYSMFPALGCEVRGASAMNEDRKEGLREMKEKEAEELQLGLCAEGFGVSNLRRLMGSEASNYTENLEGLYEKMLTKIENLAREVEKSNAKVMEMENHNRKLRHRVSKTGLE